MLQTIRERLTGWFAVVILGLIALTLVVTFGNIDTGFSGANTAATVNGEEISIREFRSLYQRQRQQWEANFRAEIPDVIATNLANNVIQSIVRSRAVAQHAREQGYRVNDTDVIEAIQTSEAFFVGGQFSQLAYEQLLRSEGITPQRFEFEQRQSMEVGQFIEGVGYTAFYTPAEFRRYIELDGETRSVDYAVLSASDKRAEIKISDEDVAAWYEANPGLFQTEESASLEYIVVDFTEILDATSVSDADAREYFDANSQEFGGVEERLASHILISTGDDDQAAVQLASDIEEKISAGESFGDLAAQYSADNGSAKNGGSLGWLGEGDSPAIEFESALFELAEGEVSQPVKTEFGYHLIKLDGLRRGAQPDYEKVAEQLRDRLRQQEATDRFTEILDELDEQALESLDGLASVASEMGLKLQTLNEFTRSGGGLPLAPNPGLVDTVFSLELLEDGENSPVVSLDDERAAVLRVTAHRLPELQALDLVRDEIRSELETEAATSAVATAGEQLVADLNAGGAVEALLAAENADSASLSDLRRGDDRVASDLNAAIFRAPKTSAADAAYRGLLLANGDFAVYRLTSVAPGLPEKYTQEDRDARKDQLAGRLGGGQATAVVETLVNLATVQVTPGLLESELGLQQ